MKHNIHISDTHQILRYTKYMELMQYYNWLSFFGKSSASVTTFSSSMGSSNVDFTNTNWNKIFESEYS